MNDREDWEMNDRDWAALFLKTISQYAPAGTPDNVSFSHGMGVALIAVRRHPEWAMAVAKRLSVATGDVAPYVDQMVEQIPIESIQDREPADDPVTSE